MRLVILDRDGVINEDRDDFIKTPDEWVPIPRSLEAIARLHRAGYQVVVMTNQSGISRGLFDLNTLNRIHVRMMDYVRRHGGQIEAIFFCPHGPDDDCACRKPRAGMYAQLADRLKSSLEGVPSVGDSMRDLEAASAAGSSPILVRTGKGRASAKILEDRNLPGLGDVPVFENLADFVEELLATESREDNQSSQRSSP
jgi:D-glycero-D-manno-heptose 1,7-bisphosphate phosphatase